MREKKVFKRVLIANRGEIAVRVARTLREMGMTPVAVYSDADRLAPHVRACDMAFRVGAAPAGESYLRAEAILAAAKAARADAIHPGYGFLSENGAFVEAVAGAGITFIGPSAQAMAVMGSKTAARDMMKKAQVPTVPGSDGPLRTEEEACRVAAAIGFPVMLKAAAGGGGKGMRIVDAPSGMASAFRAAASEARNAFGDDTVYIEKALIGPRHIEIQVFGDADGRVMWLGERECSMQRRHQKVIEESPSAVVDENLRRRMGEVACRAAAAVSYVGAGTVEFLLDADGNFYFLEMNTRLQVEHPVTEMCCGLDLVEAQVRVAQGETLAWGQDDIARVGHAIEARVYAEDPARGFVPSPGLIEEVRFPQGPGVRVDGGVAAGVEVSGYYDPMIAKVVAWAEDRDRARRRLHRALGETVVKGITTNIAFLRGLLMGEAFVSGAYDTGTIGETMNASASEPATSAMDVATVAAVIAALRRDSRAVRQVAVRDADGRVAGWRSGPWRWRGG